MDSNVLTLIVAGIAIVLAGIALFRKGGVSGTTELISTVQAQLPLAAEIADAAQVAVDAIEQERRQPGSLMTNDQALNRALTFVKQWVPGADQVSNADIIKFINAAVLIASERTATIEAAKATVAEATVATAARAAVPPVVYSRPSSD